jgi:type II secretory pathway pseudopilin PulG
VILAIAVIGIVAAIAVPGLLRARTAGNEASAIASLRAIQSAEVTYASSCGQGGYAVALEDLAKPPLTGGPAFLPADLGRSGIQKSGYIFTVTRDRSPIAGDISSAAETCNGSTGQPASSYVATAEPASPGASGVRYFAVDGGGTIFESAHAISNPIMNSTGISPIR